MDMNNLFIENSENNSNYITLDENADKWKEGILKEVYRQIPGALQYLVRIDFKNINEERGYAIGSVLVSKRDMQETIGLPLIIRDRKMYPLDVMIYKGTFLPFTKGNFGAVFQKGDVAEKPVSPYAFHNWQLYPSIIDETFPPYTKRASLLNEIEARSEDLQTLKANLSEDHDTLMKFAQNYSLEFEKICSMKGAEIKSEIETLQADMEKDFDVFQITKVGHNTFEVLKNNSRWFNPQKELVDEAGVKKFASVPLSQETTTIIVPSQDNLYVENNRDREMKDSLGEANTYGKYEVKDKAGNRVVGVLIPTVVDFDQKPKDLRLFLAGKKSAMQKRIAGLKQSDEAKILEGDLVIGRFGTLVYENGGKALATIPFTILGITSKDKTVCLNVQDSLGTMYDLILTPGIERIVPFSSALPGLTKGRNAYAIPTLFKFVEIPKLDNALVEDADEFVKFAFASDAKTNPMKFSFIQGRYKAVFEGMDKYASMLPFDMTNMRDPEARFLLASFGIGERKGSELLKTASMEDVVRLHVNYPATKTEMSEKVESAYLGDNAETLTKIASLKMNLLKEVAAIEPDTTEADKLVRNTYVAPEYDAIYKRAAELPTSEIVDKALALNFINPENIKLFVRYLPDLKKCNSRLAQLLIASRLGLDSIPEWETQSAMVNLAKVVSGLETLDAMAEK